MESLHKVKIFNPKKNGVIGTQCEIDGKEIKGVRRVDFHVSVGEEIPYFKFKTVGIPDIEMDGEIQFQFTPKTVKEAVMVIRQEFHPQSEYFKAVVASIENRLRAAVPEHGEEFAKMLADDIARQIFGYPYEDVTTLKDERQKFSKE